MIVYFLFKSVTKACSRIFAKREQVKETKQVNKYIINNNISKSQA